MQSLKETAQALVKRKPTGRQRGGQPHNRPSCPVCDGWGVVAYDAPVGHPKFGATRDCPAPGCQAAAAIQLRRVNRMYRWAKLGERYRQFRLAHFGAHPAIVELAWELIENGCIECADDWFNFGLYLYGDVGVGKTACAAAIANELNGETAVLFLRVAELLDELRATFHPDSENTVSAMLHEAMNIPWLILDDLGAHQTKSWALEKMLTLIDDRDANHRPTIITSNWPPDVLEAEFSKADNWQARRLMSRIISLTHVIEMVGPVDIRKGEAHA